MEIRTGSSYSNSSHGESSSLESVQGRSNDSQYGRKKGSSVKREIEEKRISLKKYQGGRHTKRKIQKDSEHRVPKRAFSSNNTNSVLPKCRKRGRTEETIMPNTSSYNLRPRSGGRDQLPTNHGDEDTIRRTSSSQEKQRKELQPLHRSANKFRQQEYQTKRQSTTKGPGKERRSEY
ncbi:uncharacterized protein TNCV_1174941 [Trichonephila clavipes]|nr:uncharacterized protein TNCV_1174941 [Trichonephila clavipes]